MFYEKSVPKNFAKLTGKHMCRSPLLRQLQGGGLLLYLKRDFGRGTLLFILEKIKNTYFAELLRVAALDRCMDHVQHNICKWLLLVNVWIMYSIKVTSRVKANTT